MADPTAVLLPSRADADSNRAAVFLPPLFCSTARVRVTAGAAAERLAALAPYLALAPQGSRTEFLLCLSYAAAPSVPSHAATPPSSLNCEGERAKSVAADADRRCSKADERTRPRARLPEHVCVSLG
jgi:hypothetical protein